MNKKYPGKSSKEIFKIERELYEAGKLYNDKGENDMFAGSYPTPHGEDGHDELWELGLTNQKYVAMDAETYALRGSNLDPADRQNTFMISITDKYENSKNFCYCEIEKASDWVKENVLPVQEYDKEKTVMCESYDDMMTKAKQYLCNEYPDHSLLVHCGYVVELNVLDEMDRVYPGTERVFDREILDVADMKFYHDGTLQEVGDSVNRVNELLNVEKYGNDHNPEADNINAIKCYKAIQNENIKNLELWNDRTLGEYALSKINDANKILASRDDFDGATYEINNYQDKISFENGYQATFSRPLTYDSKLAIHDEGLFTPEDYGALIKSVLETKTTDGKIYVGVFDEIPEISFWFEKEQDADRIAKMFNQDSIYDHANDEIMENIAFSRNPTFDRLLTDDALMQREYNKKIENEEIKNITYPDYYEKERGLVAADKMAKIYETIENLKSL